MGKEGEEKRRGEGRGGGEEVVRRVKGDGEERQR